MQLQLLYFAKIGAHKIDFVPMIPCLKVSGIVAITTSSLTIAVNLRRYAELPTGCLFLTSLLGDLMVTNSSADEG